MVRFFKEQVSEANAATVQKSEMYKIIQSSILTNDIPWTPVNRVYAFDFDGTLTKTASGRKFAKDQNDIALWHPNVVKKLNDLHKAGIGIVIFTNQLKVDKNYPGQTVVNCTTNTVRHERLPGGSREIFETKMSWFLKQFKFPIKMYAALEQDVYRKPSKVLWNYFVKNDNKQKVDKAGCLYVGDAAGRKGDFSCSDRKFAFNVGVPFQTPEEFFLGEQAKPFVMNGFDPHSYYSQPEPDIQPSAQQELVIMVGSPASGKSTFVKKYFPMYARINQDTLRTVKKCFKETEIALATGKSAVIDNTNPASETRAEYIKIAKKHNVPVRCMFMSSNRELVDHLNTLRCLIVKNTKKIPSIALNIYNSKLEKPTTAEGFTEVREIPFSLHFEDDVHKKLFYQVY